jgi:long-chain acyl-CoA synthetase
VSAGFYIVAAERPDATALILPGGRVTFGELAARVNRISRRLRALGLTDGDTVAAVVGNGRTYFELALATGQVGMYLVPVSNHLTSAEVAYIVEDSGARVVVADRPVDGVGTTHRFAVEGSEWRDYEDLAGTGVDAAPLDRPLMGATMGYTSGTTGRPKGVRKTLAGTTPQEALRAGTRASQVFGVRDGEGVHLCCSPLYHNAPGSFAVQALHMGHTVVVLERFDARAVLDAIARHRVTWSHLVPTHFRRLLDLPGHVRNGADISSVEALLHAGAPCPVEVKSQMLAWFGPCVWEYYGATEGTATVASPQDWLRKPGTVGRPMSGVTVHILDDDGREVAPGEAGTVWFTADFRYHEDPDKTAASRKGPLATVGDIGRLDEDGFLFLLDRRSDLIITGGVNVYPAEIEERLAEHPEVRDVAVIAIPDEQWGHRVLALVERGDPDDDTRLETELRALCDRSLAGPKRPRDYEFRSSLPRTATGKLSRAALRAPYWERTPA